MKKLLCLPILLFFVIACEQKDDDDGTTATVFHIDSAKAAIDANNAAFVKAVLAGDSVAFIASYTADGCVMPYGMPKMCGKEGLAKFLASTRQMGIGDLRFAPVEILGGKELVSEEGTFEVLDKAGTVVDKGKYIATWKQENGSWKRYRDIWNSEMPPPPARAK